MLTDAQLIRKLEFFEPLDQKIIKHIAGLCIVREFSAGEAIVRQGESGLGLYFLTGGRAKVEIDKDGSKLIVAELKEGDMFGEFAIIDDKTRSASVICLHDTRCLLLTRDSFAKVLNKHPEIALQMLRTLVGRIRNTNERISQPSGARSAQPAQAVPTPGSAPGLNEEATVVEEKGAAGIAAVTSQIASILPKPEEMVQFYSSTKGKTQEFLNRFVSTIYAMKAMLRFSMAIVGCPVTVSTEIPGENIFQENLNGVNLILFPAGKNQTIRIEAYADGVVSATIYRPIGTVRNPCAEVLHLNGPLQKNDVLRMHVARKQSIRIEPPRDNLAELSCSVSTPRH